MTHETMWMLKQVGAPNPSPDGKWVVFSLVENDFRVPLNQTLENWSVL